MSCAKHRVWLSAGAVALLVASGSPAALAQDAGQAAPEWQQYDQLDERFGPLAWLTFGEVIGSEVVDRQGQQVGEIVHLLRAKADGMIYAVVDTEEAVGDGAQVVPVDHLEVVGDNQQSRQIVMVGKGTGDFDESDFEAAAPKNDTSG